MAELEQCWQVRPYCELFFFLMKNEPALLSVCVITCGQWRQERRSWSRRLVCVNTYGLGRPCVLRPRAATRYHFQGALPQASMEVGMRAQRGRGVTRGAGFDPFLSLKRARVGVSMSNVNIGAASTAMAVSSAPTRRVCFVRQDRVVSKNEGEQPSNMIKNEGHQTRSTTIKHDQTRVFPHPAPIAGPSPATKLVHRGRPLA